MADRNQARLELAEQAALELQVGIIRSVAMVVTEQQVADLAAAAGAVTAWEDVHPWAPQVELAATRPEQVAASATMELRAVSQ